MNAVVKSWKTSKLEVFFATLAIVMMILNIIIIPVSEKLDAFYMVCSGNYMLDTHSFQHVMPEAPFDATIVVQNWLVCLVYAIAYRIGCTIGIGWFAVSFVHLLSVLFLFWTVWTLGKKLSKHRVARWIGLCVFCMFYVYISSHRVHALTYALQLWCLYFTYRICCDKFTLLRVLAIVGIYVLYINIQAGVFLVLMCYCIAIVGSTKRLFEQFGAVLAHFIGLGVAVVLNPYHMDALMYPFTLFLGKSHIGSGVVELSNLLELGDCGIWIALFYIAVVVFIMFFGYCCFLRKKYGMCNVWLLLCQLVTVIGGCVSLRIMSISCVFTVFLLFIWFDDIIKSSSSREIVNSWWSYKRFTLLALFSSFMIVSTGILVYKCFHKWSAANLSSDYVSDFAVYDEMIDKIDNPGSTVFCYTAGSRLAMLGYKVSITTRWEVWEQSCPWSDDYALDFVNSINNGKFEGAIDEINWDYILMDTTFDTCVKAIERNTISDKYTYEKIASNDVAVLFKRVNR